jgi:Tfp pilus assembly PilM family ATPase
MISEIFLPEKIGKRRLIARRIIGIAIQEDEVKIACVYAKRSKTIIELLNNQIIEAGTEETYIQRATDAVKKIMAPIKRYHQIRAAIPASIVTFKEIQVPFSDPEKIRMVLEYEIESMLPFSIHEAVVDFIITKEGKDQQPAQLLVAAVRNQDLQAVLDIYTNANIEPTNITIDLFAAYGLYQQISDYKNISNASALVDVGTMSTRIAFLQSGELRLTRSIPRGMMTVIKGISEELGIVIEDVQKKLQLHGISISNDETYNRVAQKHFINFFNDIQFTLNSFSIKLNFYEGIGKLLFIGKVINIHGLMKFSSDALQIPCEAFDCKKILATPGIKNIIKNTIIDWSGYSVALGTALPSEQQSLFDLRRKSFALIQYPLITQQFITMLVILVVLLGVVGFNGYRQLNTLQDAVNNANNKAVVQLKTILPKEKQPQKLTLAAMVREAEKVLSEKSDLWASFSPTYRMNPLVILLEITTFLEKHLNEVTIVEINMNNKEKGEKRVSIDGFFKSKRGSGFHFNDWAPLELKFKESPFFTLLEDISTTPAEEKGIRFSVKLKVTTKEK